MNQYLYRYISFETFVGMIQKQALTFVLPEIWEDPKENDGFFSFLTGLNDPLEKALFMAIYQKTFAQSWSLLEESDAMWRIYSYNKRAIRIKILWENAVQLPGVDVLPVTYSDQPISFDGGDIRPYLASLSLKRLAFKHEEEVRLIKAYKFLTTEDADKHVRGMLVLSQHPQKREISTALFPDRSLEGQVESICKMLNVNKDRRTTEDVSYKHIPNFIAGVMVHPLAPAWFVEVVQEFCVRNNLAFEGQSQLYLM